MRKTFKRKGSPQGNPGLKKRFQMKRIWRALRKLYEKLERAKTEEEINQIEKEIAALKSRHRL